MYNLECASGDSVSRLHRIVKCFIGRSVKGKKFLQSSTLQRSCNSNEDELRDIRSRWPEVLSRTLMDALVNNFKKNTSSTELTTSICTSCAETMLKVQSWTVPIAEIDLTILRWPDYHECGETDDNST